AAGSLLRLTSLSVFSRLTALPSASLWARAGVAEAISGLAGFGVEGATFPAASQLAEKVEGRHPQWRSDTLASSYFFLGGLRLGGLGARALQYGVGIQGGLATAVFQQLGMLGGIHLGHLAS